MNTIRATVSHRLLSKAERLFTGTLQGRITELLQNARRAGATHVEITNRDGVVTVRDNGRGVTDFKRLLDLGESGWSDATEASEDPCGVGLFCLAPRTVTIRSNGSKITIRPEGWSGMPIDVVPDVEPFEGTELQFADKTWEAWPVTRQAAFSSMTVTLDGTPCDKQEFVSSNAIHHPELGCRVEIRPPGEVTPLHRSTECGYQPVRVVINFHGQLVGLHERPMEEDVFFLVDLTGEPTDIRLLLPARTRLIENDAYHRLLSILEIEGYRFVERRGTHRLSFRNWERARALGIELPESEPKYSVGTLPGETPPPIAINKSKDWALEKCFLIDRKLSEHRPSAADNVHLLAALGTFDSPFVPVTIPSRYDGYSWANLMTITDVVVSVGRTLHEQWLWGGKIRCVDALVITARTGDGREFSSAVCIAMGANRYDPENQAYRDIVYVTPDARGRVSTSDIWHHFGGWCDGEDTYDTQCDQFGSELEQFWEGQLGLGERIHRRIAQAMNALVEEWESVTATRNGRVEIRREDGQIEKFECSGRAFA